jgi:RES domain-containing protein
MTGAGRRHDRAILDALEAIDAEAFAGPVWRVTSQARDPLRGSTAGGRWSPPGEFETLYTSLTPTGALAEIGYRLSLEPVWPSRMEYNLHRITVRTEKTLRFADLNALGPIGVDTARYPSFEYAATQSIAAAAYFLEFDGLIAPSARAKNLNLVLFTERLHSDALNIAETRLVDWNAWRNKPIAR